MATDIRHAGTARQASPRRAPADWLVVGAGFSGATVAERLAALAGRRVLVVDRRQHLAGNAFDLEDSAGIRVHRYGAHIFHTKSERVWRYLSRFTEWLPYVHRVRASVDGQLLPIPCNLETIRALAGHEMVTRLLALLGRGQRIPILQLINHPDADVRATGELLHDKLFLRYTLKQWGLSPEALDRSVTGRVPVLTSDDDGYFADPHQGIPTHGYTALVESMLDHPKVTVELGRDYRSLPPRLRQLPTVYTGPVDEFFSYRHGPLPYRSLRFEEVRVPTDRVQPVAVINHPNDNLYTRVIEHAHFSGQHLGVSTVTYEYPEAHEPGRNEPYYPVPTEESHRLHRAYTDEAARLARRVYFVGRLAEYRYYDMDQAVAHALTLFDKIANDCPAAPAAAI